tara:strand:+ start:6969 stop:7250 length:282 start_codon:yes stop_codon:yes gene_type:complete
MSTTTVGDGAATMAGTTHGYGTVVGDGTILTTVGDGAGTTHGDITVGASMAPIVGAGLDTTASIPIMDGVATTEVTGTTHITIEDTMAETMLI